jgi:hypothetical protein
MLGLENAADTLELLQDLSKVVTTIGTRILLVVQDLERAGKAFDTRHLQRLLWALHDVKVLTAREPYMIGRLITQTGADRTAEAFDAWKDYLPQLLLDGAKTHPEALVPEIANLAGDEQSGTVAAGDDYPPIFINRYTIDRGRMAAFFGDRLDEVLNVLASYPGNDPYAARAREAAKNWTDERRRGSPAEDQMGTGDGNVSPDRA